MNFFSFVSEDPNLYKILFFAFLYPRQPRRVQIDEFTFNMDKRDKFIKDSIASAEKIAKEKEKQKIGT